jgi:hypothetical protein
MAYFARLDSNNVVTQVIVVANKDTADSSGAESEAIGIAYLKGIFGEDTKWAQTSYNAKIRGRYSGIGYIYDTTRDAFITPKPYDSWILNDDTTEWEPPIEKPPLTDPMKANAQDWIWNPEINNWTESEFTPPEESAE